LKNLGFEKELPLYLQGLLYLVSPYKEEQMKWHFY